MKLRNLLIYGAVALPLLYGCSNTETPSIASKNIGYDHSGNVSKLEQRIDSLKRDTTATATNKYEKVKIEAILTNAPKYYNKQVELTGIPTSPVHLNDNNWVLLSFGVAEKKDQIIPSDDIGAYKNRWILCEYDKEYFYEVENLLAIVKASQELNLPIMVRGEFTKDNTINLREVYGMGYTVLIPKAR